MRALSARAAALRFPAALGMVAGRRAGKYDLVVQPQHADRDVTIGQYDGRLAANHRDDSFILLEGSRGPFPQATVIGLHSPGEWPRRIDHDQHRRIAQRDREDEAGYFRLPKRIDVGIETPAAEKTAAGTRPLIPNGAAAARNRM